MVILGSFGITTKHITGVDPFPLKLKSGPAGFFIKQLQTLRL